MPLRGAGTIYNGRIGLFNMFFIPATGAGPSARTQLICHIVDR